MRNKSEFKAYLFLPHLGEVPDWSFPPEQQYKQRSSYKRCHNRHCKNSPPIIFAYARRVS
jgi:hypothetical protein